MRRPLESPVETADYLMGNLQGKAVDGRTGFWQYQHC